MTRMTEKENTARQVAGLTASYGDGRFHGEGSNVHLTSESVLRAATRSVRPQYVHLTQGQTNYATWVRVTVFLLPRDHWFAIRETLHAEPPQLTPGLEQTLDIQWPDLSSLGLFEKDLITSTMPWHAWFRQPADYSMPGQCALPSRVVQGYVIWPTAHFEFPRGACVGVTNSPELPPIWVPRVIARTRRLTALEQTYYYATGKLP